MVRERPLSRGRKGVRLERLVPQIAQDRQELDEAHRGRQPREIATRGALDLAAEGRVVGRRGVVDDMGLKAGLADDRDAAGAVLCLVGGAVYDSEVVEGSLPRAVRRAASRASRAGGNRAPR